MENEIVKIEAAAPRFTSEVTHDLPTRKEVNKLYSLLHMGNIFREGLVSIILLVLFGYLFCYAGSWAGYSRVVFVIGLCYWFPFFFNIFRDRKGGKSYRLMLQRNGGNPVHNIIAFGAESFQVQNTYTEEVNEYSYSRIRSIAQTKNFFLLYRELNQCTVVSKSHLTGGNGESLLDFLLEKMPIPRIKTPTAGLTVRWIGYVLWALSLGLAVCCQIFLV